MLIMGSEPSPDSSFAVGSSLFSICVQGGCRESACALSILAAACKGTCQPELRIGDEYGICVRLPPHTERLLKKGSSGQRRALGQLGLRKSIERESGLRVHVPHAL